MDLKGKAVPELSNSDWLMDFAFLNDTSQAMARLNVKLQGENKLVHELFHHLRTFERDLQLYERHLRENRIDLFPTIKGCFKGNNAKLAEYSDRVATLRDEFSSRFTDFRGIRDEMDIFSLPCTVDVNTAPCELQLELNSLQEDAALKQQFHEMNLVEFYQSLPDADYGSLKQFAKRFISMFGSTYRCEQLFSKVKNLKCKLRSRLTDVHLLDNLRLCTSLIQPNIEKLVQDASGFTLALYY